MFDSFVQKINSFQKGKKCSIRQTYVLLIQNLIVDTIEDSKDNSFDSVNYRSEEIF